MRLCQSTGAAPPAAKIGLLLLGAMSLIVALAGRHVIGPAATARVVGIGGGALAILTIALLRKTRRLASSGAVRTAVVGFLTLCVVAGAITELAGTQVIGPATAARGFGLVIGAMAILTGNFLPKARAFETGAGGGPRTRAAERTIGWILVLAGVAFIVSFAFAPLARAKSLAAAAGMGALLLIAVTSVQLIAAGLMRSRAAALTPGDAIERSLPPACSRRRPMLSLLVGFLFTLATACTQYAFAGQPPGDAIAAWMSTAFLAGVAILSVLRARGRKRLG